jgi:hypothetical protein
MGRNLPTLFDPNSAPTGKQNRMSLGKQMAMAVLKTEPATGSQPQPLNDRVELNPLSNNDLRIAIARQTIFAWRKYQC